MLEARQTTVTGSFEFEMASNRVLFGAGRIAEVADEALGLGRRVITITTPRGVAETRRIEEDLGTEFVGRIGSVRQHVPSELAEVARTRVAELRGGVLVAVGGGSAIGTAKAVALTTGLPIVAVPTTYSGSEMTPIWGITAKARKETGRDLRVLPRVVVYDPELTVSLPLGLSVASGMNAIAHCTEAIWHPKSDPLTSAVAAEGIRAIASGLRAVTADLTDIDGRSALLTGAFLAGTALSTVGTAIHHKLAHVLGGTFGLPHADVHAVLLPYTTAFEAQRRPAAIAQIARALDAENAARALWDLGRQLGAPGSLAELGMRDDRIAEAAEIVGQSGQATESDARQILQQALYADRP